ncbi:MAG TPA: lasso peptide biosynthesis B2 protein [Pyrinomonadaceae bacterium]|nr:lasso peptide biosynthesis B2 protein [Pyrinomonadaceae bacterium]
MDEVLMPVESVHVRPEKAWVMRRAVHFLSHRPGEAFLLLRMAMWVALLSFLIKFLPLPRVLSLIAGGTRGTSPKNPAMTQQRLAQLVDALLGINFLCFTPTCWKRAPVLYRYLGLYGIETRIVFGVRKGHDSLLAGHAWLEADGQPLLETSPPRYTTTYSFPA